MVGRLRSVQSTSPITHDLEFDCKYNRYDKYAHGSITTKRNIKPFLGIGFQVGEDECELKNNRK